MAMTRLQRTLAVAGGLAIAAPLALFSAHYMGGAADHLDAPARTDPAFDTTPDTAADIADIYVWHTSDSVVVALTFAGPQPSNMPPTYDRDVLYTINISNDEDNADVEFPIRFRFGRDGDAVGVQVVGVPGSSGPIVGNVEATLTQGPVTVRAGLYDDPFFFDLQGFRETRSTGTLAFRSDRDFFRGQNDTAIVIQFPRSAIENGNNPLEFWAESARFGGQL